MTHVVKIVAGRDLEISKPDEQDIEILIYIFANRMVLGPILLILSTAYATIFILFSGTGIFYMYIQFKQDGGEI